MITTVNIEGKTKCVTKISGGIAYWRNKDVITKGDGASMHELPGKGALATATNGHICDMVLAQGIPLAYIETKGDEFVTQLVDMIPVEVVVCNEAAVNGSYSKRNPHVSEGTVFKRPVVQFFIKTAGKRFKGISIEKDDPYMVFSDDGTRLTLHHPQKPVDHERPMVEVSHELMSVSERRELHEQLHVCRELALQVNHYLSVAWGHFGGRLIDFKIECGIRQDGQIVVADVIDCDSWRVIWNGQQLSKQRYRDGADLSEVLRVYQLAERITRGFCD